MRYSMNVSIDLVCKECEKYINDLNQDENHRYRSWEHCYKQFNDARKLNNPQDDEELVDYLSLHLGFYLASTGMYRGTSFLMFKDYKFHKEIVELLLSPVYADLYGIQWTDLSIEKRNYYLSLLFDKNGLVEEITNTYNSLKSQPTQNRSKIKINEQEVSKALISKILLGTLGCVPAFEQNFKRITSKINKGYAKFYAKSIDNLIDFYVENQNKLEEIRTKINNDKNHHIVEYPQMKIIDMIFWQLGEDFL